MSIVLCCFVPDGIAIAADSRLTRETRQGDVLHKHPFSDGGLKLYPMHSRPYAIAHTGANFLRGAPVSQMIRDVDAVHPDDAGVLDVANALLARLEGAEASAFLVAGYEGSYPWVYSVNKSTVTPHNQEGPGTPKYGFTAQGNTDAIKRLIFTPPQTPIPYKLLPLPDAIALSEYLVAVQIGYERFREGLQECGGETDTLVLLPGQVYWHRNKLFPTGKLSE